MRRIVLLLIILGSTYTSVFGARQVDFFIAKDSLEEAVESTENMTTAIDNTKTETDQPRFKKLKAAILSLLLGHFGVHRIYLGTNAAVPVVYSLTLGGGLGLLPLADFIAIITAKDLNRYMNNDKVIMWVR